MRRNQGSDDHLPRGGTRCPAPEMILDLPFIHLCFHLEERLKNLGFHDFLVCGKKCNTMVVHHSTKSLATLYMFYLSLRRCDGQAPET